MSARWPAPRWRAARREKFSKMCSGRIGRLTAANLAVVRDVGGRNRLEYPIGKVLYETGGWISHPRISPKGDMVAFLDHSAAGRR